MVWIKRDVWKMLYVVCQALDNASSTSLFQGLSRKIWNYKVKQMYDTAMGLKNDFDTRLQSEHQKYPWNILPILQVCSFVNLWLHMFYKYINLKEIKFGLFRLHIFGLGNICLTNSLSYDQLEVKCWLSSFYKKILKGKK